MITTISLMRDAFHVCYHFFRYQALYRGASDISENVISAIVSDCVLSRIMKF